MRIRPLLSPLLALLLVTACRTTAPGDEIESITIVGFNDIHGAFAPVSATTREKEGVTPVSYEKGGLAGFATQVARLRSESPGRLLLVDAGDCFQGTLESNGEEGAPVVRLYNALGVDAMTIGNHEFDFGPVGPDDAGADRLGALRARIAESHFPWLSANIVDRKTRRPLEMENFAPSKILQVGRLRVGVIGLATAETPTTTRAANVRDLEFTSLAEATLREAQKLRREGAQIVLLLGHVGQACDDEPGGRLSKFRSATDAQTFCGRGHEMSRLIFSLPRGTIDAAIAGHSHNVVHHWIGGIPVIQGGTRLPYFNVMRLSYDLAAHRLLTERTTIEGPVPVCPKVFANQGDCDGSKPAPEGGRGPLVTPQFHGAPVEPDPTISAMIDEILRSSEANRERIVGEAARTIEHLRASESPLGNLVADTVREAVSADVALINSGGIRASIEAGPITFGELYRALPFDNRIAIATVTGAELKEVLRIATSGHKGVTPLSGVVCHLIDRADPAPSNDLDGDGEIAGFEVDRLLDARLDDGSLVEDMANYRLALPDFIATGGDNFGVATSKIPLSRIDFTSGPTIREAVENRLSRSGPVNDAAHPLVDPKKPRFLFVKTE
jgi:5'-nucleotidase